MSTLPAAPQILFVSWITACAVLSGALGPAAFGSAAPKDDAETPFGGELEVREVLLDVLVTDTDGNVIVGLDREDFIVEDEGRLVDVESVSFYSNRSYLGTAQETDPESLPPAPAPAEDLFQAPEDRYFVLLFYRPPVGTTADNRLYLRLPQAGKMAYQWLIEELLPNDHVAVASYHLGLELHHDFTRDRSRLGLALRSASRANPRNPAGPPGAAPGAPASPWLPWWSEKMKNKRLPGTSSKP